MFGRKRTGSLGSFDEKDSKGRKKFHPKSQKKQLSSSLLIVRNSHVSLSKFDEESFALIQSLYNSDTKEKNKKDLVKMANSWVDTASSLRQSAPFEVTGKNNKHFMRNVIHACYRATQKFFHSQLIQNILSVLGCWEEAYTSSSEKVPENLKNLKEILSGLDPQNALVGFRVSQFVIENLISSKVESLNECQLESPEQLAHSILRLRNDFVDPFSLSTKSARLAQKALYLQGGNPKAGVEDLVVVPRDKQTFRYGRVCEVGKDFFMVAFDPLLATPVKVPSVEKFPEILAPLLSQTSSFSRFVDDGLNSLMVSLNKAFDSHLQIYLKEKFPSALTVIDFDTLTLTQPYNSRSDIYKLRTLSTHLQSILCDKEEQILEEGSQVIREELARLTPGFEMNDVLLSHREPLAARMKYLERQCKSLAKLRVELIESATTRHYVTLQTDNFLTFDEDSFEFNGTEGDSDEPLISPDGGNEKTITRSIDSILRRSAALNSSRRPTAHPAPPRRLTTFGNDGKWMDPSPSSLKTKAGSVKVQLQRKRVFLGSLIDEYTIYCTRLSKLNFVSQLPQELQADKKNRVKPKHYAIMFQTLLEIRKIEEDLLVSLKDCISKWPSISIGSVLESFATPYARSYTEYVTNVNVSMTSFLQLFKTNKVIHNFFKKNCDGLRPEDYVIDAMKLPLAHISVFANFLQKSLNDTTEGDPEFAELQKWHNKLTELQKVMTAREASMDSLVQLFEISKKITGYPGKFFKSDRRFLMEGPLTLDFVLPERGGVKESNYYYFLFSDCLLGCQVEGKRRDRVYYVIRNINLDCITNLDLHADRGEKSNSFTINLEDFSSMTFTASSSSEKEAWASKLWGLLEETAQKKVFGVDLLELMSRQQEPNALASGEGAPELEIPKVMLDCLHYIYTKGIHRRSVLILEEPTPDSCVSKIEYWKKKYDRGKAVDLLMMEPDLVVVVGLLKTWLSELPEPLIPWTSYSKTMDTEDKKTSEEKLSNFQEVLKSMPIENKLALNHLLCLCEDVSQVSPAPSRICYAFASVVLRPEQGTLSKREGTVVFNLVKSVSVLFPKPPDPQRQAPSQHLDVESGLRLGVGKALGSRNRSASAFVVPE